MKKPVAPTPAVKVGQVWKDMDPRASRHLKILSLEIGAPYAHDRAVVRACRPSGEVYGTPKSRIRLDRLRSAGSRGYSLVMDIN